MNTPAPVLESPTPHWASPSIHAPSATTLDENRGAFDQTAPGPAQPAWQDGGEPLDRTTRTAMESRYGHDFGSVRVHADQAAAASAAALSARAFTVGSDVVLGAGETDWRAAGGQRLLAHEMAHVVQQERGGTTDPADGRERALEQDARAAEQSFADDRGAIEVKETSAPGIARQPLGADLLGAEEEPRSLRGSISRRPEDTNDAALEREVRALQRWTNAHPFSEQRDHLFGELEDLRAESLRRQTLPKPVPTPVPAAPAPPPAEGSIASLVSIVHAGRMDVEAEANKFAEAKAHFQATGQMLHTDKFAPIEFKKGEHLTIAERWNLLLTAMGENETNLEAAHFEPHFFVSEAEFNREWARRREEYLVKLKACSADRSPKLPKLSRLHPERIDCRERVAAEYFPMQAAGKVASYRWAYNDSEIGLSATTDQGLAASIAFEVAHEGLDWDTKRSGAAADFAGGAANFTPAAEKFRRETPENPNAPTNVGPPPAAKVAPAPPKEKMPTPDPVQPVRPPAAPTPSAPPIPYQQPPAPGTPYLQDPSMLAEQPKTPTPPATAAPQPTSTPPPPAPQPPTTTSVNPAKTPARQSNRNVNPGAANRVTEGAEGGKEDKAPRVTPKPVDKQAETQQTLLSNKEDPKGGKKSTPAVTVRKPAVKPATTIKPGSSTATKPAPAPSPATTPVPAKEEKKPEAPKPTTPPQTEKPEEANAPKTAEPAKPAQPTAGETKTDPSAVPAGPGPQSAAAPRLISHEVLNQPVPQNKGITGPKRRLDAVERKTANEIVEVLQEVNEGKQEAMKRLEAYRPHQHTTGDLAGWWSVDLVQGNPGALNVMRLYFRMGKDNKLVAMVRQGH